MAENIAFERVKRLRSLVMDDGLGRFEGLLSGSGLRHLKWSQAIPYVPGRMFERYAGLRSVILPEGLEEVGERAFFWSGI